VRRGIERLLGRNLATDVRAPTVVRRSALADPVEPRSDGGTALEFIDLTMDGDEHFLAHVGQIRFSDAEVPEDSEDVGRVLIENLSRSRARRGHRPSWGSMSEPGAVIPDISLSTG
jgi:hypothetical protein